MAPRVYQPIKFDRPIVEILAEKHAIAKAEHDLVVTDAENQSFDLIISRMISVAEQGKHYYVFGTRYYDVIKILDHEESRDRLLERLRQEKLIPNLVDAGKYGTGLRVEFKPKEGILDIQPNFQPNSFSETENPPQSTSLPSPSQQKDSPPIKE